MGEAFHNWAGNQSSPRRRSVPLLGRGGRAGRTGRRRDGAPGAHDRHRALLHRGRGHRRAPAAARTADRDPRGRPRRAGSRPRRHDAQELNEELDRLGLALHNMGDITEQTVAGAIRPAPTAPAGTSAGLADQVLGLELVLRRRRGAHGARRREENRDEVTSGTCSTRPGRPGRARRADRGDLPGGAALPAAAHRQPMSLDEILGSLRRDHRRRATTATSSGCRTPTPADQAQQPARGRPADPAERVQALAGQRVSGEHAVRRPVRRRQAVPRRDPPAQHVLGDGALGLDPHRRRVQDLHRARGTCASWRWSTPSRASISARPSTRPATWWNGGTGGSPSRSRCGSPRPTTRAVHRVRQGIGLHRLPHLPATPNPAYFEGVEEIMTRLRRPPALGQDAHPRRGLPGHGLSPVRRLPGAARPAGPGARFHQRLSGHRPGLTPGARSPNRPLPATFR